MYPAVEGYLREVLERMPGMKALEIGASLPGNWQHRQTAIISSPLQRVAGGAPATQAGH